jgi:GTP:adenosylcobinamide-phosphate guanylyltransferase
MITEVRGIDNTMFFVTIPGPVVSNTLEQLRKNGIGVSVGRVVLSSIDYMKPDLSKPLADSDSTLSSAKNNKKSASLKGISHFQKARKTTEEMYNEISNNANMNINTWMNLIGQSVRILFDIANVF